MIVHELDEDILSNSEQNKTVVEILDHSEPEEATSSVYSERRIENGLILMQRNVPKIEERPPRANVNRFGCHKPSKSNGFIPQLKEDFYEEDKICNERAAELSPS